MSGGEKTPSGPLRCRERRGLSGCILLADTHSERRPRPREKRADVAAAAFSLRCRWPWRSRLTESLPNDSPGNWWQSSQWLREGQGWGCRTSIALCVPHGPGAPARPEPWREGADTNPKRLSLPGKVLPVSICNSEKSPSLPKLAASLHVSFTDGAFSSRI